MNSLLRTSSSTRSGQVGPLRASLIFIFLLLGSVVAQAQTTNWTGNTNRDWNTATNWSGGRVPLATDDAVIPSAPANQPVLNAVAVAKSVEVQNGASLSITAAGSLTITDSRRFQTFTASFWNKGRVVSGGQLIINSTTVPVYSLVNSGNFDNVAGGQISIDGANSVGLHNISGSFVNSSTITIGKMVSVGQYGVFNTASFSNNGCSALLWVVSDAVITDQVGGALSNTGTIIENATGNSNISSNAGLVQNLNGGTFNIGTNTGVLTTTPGTQPTITSSPSLTITQGQSTTLTASGAQTYSWSSGQSTSAISVSVAGPYSVTGTIGSCSSVATVTLTVNVPVCGAGLSGPIWTGCVSTDWNTAGNWASGTVPTATDDVVIPSGPANQPVLSTTATAKSVAVQTGASLSISSAGSLTINSFATLGGFPTAFYNQGTVSNDGTLMLGNTAPVGLIGLHNTGTFTNTGTLQVDRATNQGINNRAAATFTNTGSITIGASVPMGTQGIWNQATFTHTGGTITIDRITGDGLLNSGSFVSSATITIGASASVTGNGIQVTGGSFQNNTGGSIQIDRTGSHAIASSSTFTNAAIIKIGSLTTVSGRGFELGGAGTFINAIGGAISLNRCGGVGMIGSPSFINSSTLTIGDIAFSGQDNIYLGSGTFTNTATGEIRADRAFGNGIWNVAGTFRNDGKVFIGSVANTGGTGILNTGTSFSNTAGASILLDRVGRGLTNTTTFTNAGQIRMGSIASLRGSGFLNGNNSGNVAAVFNNLAGALLQIDQTAANQDGITNELLTTFTNAGTVSIGTSGTIGGNGITNAGTFSNSACAPLTVFAAINNSGGFTNAGLFTVSTTQAHTNTGTLTNNGIIDYPQGNPIPNVVNNDVIASAISSCSNTISPALQLGGNSSQFTVGTTWYKDQALTQPAGAYNQGTNTFTATNLPPGSSTLLYFAATDNTNNCTKTVSVSVTVNQSVTASIIPSAMTVCAGTPVSLTALGAVGAGTSWQWNTGAITQAITVATNGPSGATGIPGSPTGPAGPYSVTVTTAAGCSASATITLTVNPIPVASISPSSLTVCQGQPASLTASGGIDYLWSTGETTAVINVTATGTYSVTVSGQAETGPTGATGVSGGRLAAVSGCSSTTSVMVTVNALPVAGLVSSGTLTCAQTSVTLTASGGITGETFSYTFTTGSGTVLGTPGAGNTLVVNNPGTYSVRVANASGCMSTTSIVIRQDNSAPTATLVSSGSLSCSVSSVTLTASGGSSYTFTNPGGAVLPGSGNTRVVSSGGQYSVTVANANGCTSVASVSVSQDNSVPTASIIVNPSLTITQGQTATLTASATGAAPFTYGWSTSQTTPAISVSTAATYSLTVTAGNGCSATASTTVSVTMTPVVTASFAITGVTTVDCTPVLPDRYSISFTPQYAGLTGQSITFSIANELLPTTAAGPYSLQLYTDNSILTLKATQAGTPSQSVSFSYNWLAACRASVSANTPPRVMMSIPPQSSTVGVGFSYVIPAGTFTDDQTPGSLVLTASGLPSGLSLSGYTISGTPSTTLGSPLSVSITATDPGSLSVSTSFVLTVVSGPATPPIASGVFSITGVSLLRCTPVADRINISFAPQYAGLNGQAIAFRVVNELAPTNDPAPYSLTLYRDNPVIRLRATQTGSVGEASFDYNWLTACASIGADNTPPRVVNPVGSQTAVVGVSYSLNLSNVFADQETPNGLVLTASGLPAGLSLVGTAISGTPSVSGTSTITLTASDPGSLSVSTSFMLTVSPAASQTITPPAGFAITGVQTVSCVAVSGGLRRVTFTPQYSGLNGQAITFRVVNELAPTSNPGPYSLNLYTDNPVISLRAVQSGTPGEVSYGYNWLSACGSARVSAEPVGGLAMTVLGNPVGGETVSIEVRGASGQRLVAEVVDAQGHRVSESIREDAGLVERLELRVGRDAGVYLLRVSTPTEQKTIKLLKQ